MAGLYEKRRGISEMADVSRLEPLKYLNMIGTFAKTFGLDPDIVYQKSFNTVANFLVTWKEDNEFGERYAQADKLMNQHGNPS